MQYFAHSIFVIISLKERFGCFSLTVFLLGVMWLLVFCAWVGLGCVRVAFPRHTLYLFWSSVANRSDFF